LPLLAAGDLNSGADVFAKLLEKTRLERCILEANGNHRMETDSRMSQQTHRILILDDEEAVRRVLEKALEHLGYELESVSTGPEALALLSSTNYDLVLCDIQLPGLSGLDFFRELESHHPEMTDRVIFMTGDLVRPDLQSFLKKIDANVLRKPFDLSGLYQMVQSILKRQNP
jgi:CheY-like chemotaxis protein